MKSMAILGLVLILAMLVPGMISCSGDTSDSTVTTYSTSASPAVIVKTVPVPGPRVVIPAPGPASHPWWHNWHWPWHHPHP